MNQAISKEFAISYKHFREFYAEMRDYKVARERPTDITDSELDAIAEYADYISAWAKYIKEYC